MKNLVIIASLAFVCFMSACTQCYTCTIPNTDTITDYCGKGSELSDAVEVAESVGYKCEKR